MSRTANVFARIEPELKEDSESILSQLGIPMSNAIGLFLRQVVIHRGLPFEVKLPERKPVAADSLSVDEFNAEIEKGYRDMKEGKVRPASDVFADLQKDYDL
jgi:DNA-damage-inducible protein J